MKRTEVVDYGLEFNSLTEREATNIIVIHHTGNPCDDDLSAEQIHESHLNIGWAGIGYHFVVRKDGTVEYGRPVECVGSHAYGENYHSIGVHLCGNFEITSVEPTSEQIESTARLIADLAEDYGLTVTCNTVIGHRDLMATCCPGENLYNMLQIITGKANWYLNN